MTRANNLPCVGYARVVSLAIIAFPERMGQGTQLGEAVTHEKNAQWAVSFATAARRPLKTLESLD